MSVHLPTVMKSSVEKEKWRVSLLWETGNLFGMQSFEAACRRLRSLPGILYRPFVCINPDTQLIRAALRWRPDGFLTRSGDARLIAALRAGAPGKPLVSIVRIDPALAEVQVTGNREASVNAQVECFRRNGVRSFTGFTVDGGDSAAMMEWALRRAAQPAEHVEPVIRLTANPIVLQDDPQPEHLKALANRLHAMPRPAGICTTAPHAASYILRVCNGIGLRVPEDVQIISVGGLDECLTCVPTLSAMSFPAERMGELAVDALSDLLEGKQPSPPPHIYVNAMHIVERGSTAPVNRSSAHFNAQLNEMRIGALRGDKVVDVLRRARRGSPTTFYKRFQEVVGATPAEYLRRERIKEAKRLLRETTMKLPRVAEESGFGNYKYFGDLFRRETGMTPGAYRKANS